MLALEPLFATAIGDRRFDGRLPDHSRAGLAAARTTLVGLLARTEALEPPPGQAVTHSALVEVLTADLAHVEGGLATWSVDPLDGVPVPFLQAGAYQPVATAADRDALLERWRAMGTATDAYAAELLASLADGLVASRAPVGAGAGPPRLAARHARRPVAPAPASGPRPGRRRDRCRRRRPRRLRRPRRRGRRRCRPARPRAPPRDPRRRDPPRRATRRPRRPRAHPRGRGDLRAPRPGAHLARHHARRVPCDRPRGDRAHRRRDGGAGRPGARDPDPARGHPGAARGPGPPLHDPRRGRGGGRRRARPGDRGHPGLVRATPEGSLRGRRGWAPTRRSTRPSPTTGTPPRTAHGPASTRSTPRTPRRVRATRRRSSPTTSRSPATTSRSRSPRSCRTCPRSGATSVRPPTSRAGACTSSAWRTRWASTRATSTGSACSRSTPGGRRGSSSTPGIHALGWTRDQAIAFMVEHTALAPEQHRQRGRPVHRRAGPGARLQDRPAGAAAPPRRGP